MFICDECKSISLVLPSSPESPTTGPHRECFDVTITDNNFENTESFFSIQEDTSASQIGAIITHNQTNDI